MTIRQRPTSSLGGTGSGPLRAPVTGSLLGGSLAVLAYQVAAVIGPHGLFGLSGNTLEGIPFDRAMTITAACTGALLGWVSGARAAESAHPLRWIALLSAAAGPVGAIFLAMLVIATGAGLDRAVLGLVLLVSYSFWVAVPLALPVAVVSVVVLRSILHVPSAMAAVLLAFLVLVAVGAIALGLAGSPPTYGLDSGLGLLGAAGWGTTG